jgi:ligand-binding SRPBCC domain-containing protein
MRAHALRAEQRIGRPLPEVFEFFSRASNLERITPPWMSFELMGDPGKIEAGTLIRYRLKVRGVPLRWTSRIDVFETDHVFVDRQLKGPYELWVHRHEFMADGDETIVRDEVRYQLPLGILGVIAHLLFVRRDLKAIFAYRQQAVVDLLGAPVS